MKRQNDKKPGAWRITLRHIGSGKTKVVRKAAGLSEAEAVRCALIDAGANWRLHVLAEREDQTAIYR